MSPVRDFTTRFRNYSFRPPKMITVLQSFPSEIRVTHSASKEMTGPISSRHPTGLHLVRVHSTYRQEQRMKITFLLALFHRPHSSTAKYFQLFPRVHVDACEMMSVRSSVDEITEAFSIWRLVGTIFGQKNVPGSRANTLRSVWEDGLDDHLGHEFEWTMVHMAKNTFSDPSSFYCLHLSDAQLLRMLLRKQCIAFMVCNRKIALGYVHRVNRCANNISNCVQQILL